jgi:hypothetical protein
VPALPAESSPSRSSAGGVSLSVIVPTAVPSAMLALTGALSVTVKFSAVSKTPSSVMATVKVCDTTPGAKLSVPVAAAKSTPAMALPLPAAKSTLTG